MGQQHWMRQHAESGGRAHLMLWVIKTDELFVLNSRDALAYQGTLSQELLRVMHPPIKRRDCSADAILDKLRR
jgi:hypothetical protein